MASSSLLSLAARRLEGKVAVITGGASGMGECTARLFCRHGAKVVIADIQDDKGRSLCHDIGPASASYIHCDVTREDDVKSAVGKAVADHGKLDILFANAGIMDSPLAPLTDQSKSEFDRVLATNVTGAFLSIKHAALAMAAARRGSIVATASVASVVAGLAPNAYTCSKHAVAGLVQNAAAELGRVGIRVNCVSPYGVATPLALAAFGTGSEEFEQVMEGGGVLKGVRLKAQDIAEAVLYLASDESRYVSGHNLVVDGAYSVARGSMNPNYN